MLSLVTSLFGKDKEAKPQKNERGSQISESNSIQKIMNENGINSSDKRSFQNLFKTKNQTPRHKSSRNNDNHKDGGFGMNDSQKNLKTETEVNKIMRQTQRNYESMNSSFNSSKRKNSCDDKEGHFIVVEGENFTNRFVIQKLLGQGTFGRVMKCYDRLNNKQVAIKVIRAVDKYREAARIEIRVLKTLENFDPNNKYNCIRLNEWFDYRNHICLVFDLLGPSVFDFLKYNEFRPFSLAQVQSFTSQLLKSVAYCHHLRMIHTDLKPENILLLSSEYSLADFGIKTSSNSSKNGENLDETPNIIKTKVLKSTDIKLIDFGSTTFEDEYHSSVVSTRHYRAPEIILELGWTFPCDIWSIACVIIELLTGEVLFQTHENLEHLAMMEVLLGRIPKDMINKVNSNLKPQFFQKNLLAYPTRSTSSKSLRNVRNMIPLSTLVNPEAGIIHKHLYDLLEKMLRFDPRERITALDALKHPFFSLNIKSTNSGSNNKKLSLPNPGYKINKYQFTSKKCEDLNNVDNYRFISASPRLFNNEEMQPNSSKPKIIEIKSIPKPKKREENECHIDKVSKNGHLDFGMTEYGLINSDQSNYNSKISPNLRAVNNDNLASLDSNKVNSIEEKFSSSKNSNISLSNKNTPLYDSPSEGYKSSINDYMESCAINDNGEAIDKKKNEHFSTAKSMLSNSKNYPNLNVIKPELNTQYDLEKVTQGDYHTNKRKSDSSSIVVEPSYELELSDEIGNSNSKDFQSLKNNHINIHSTPNMKIYKGANSNKCVYGIENGNPQERVMKSTRKEIDDFPIRVSSLLHPNNTSEIEKSNNASASNHLQCSYGARDKPEDNNSYDFDHHIDLESMTPFSISTVVNSP
ncbi:Serine/threonine-protein kinase AFC1 [Smittium culicis]|uniref:Serine/threonine-protein kinase AFC1 n=1 Tax=Smittium culicis TaxID=133412 RepID=A0A1R1YHR9_9FUNG|nr:Serine/threonine-protein kinase AFC1 [Smittium culicis]